MKKNARLQCVKLYLPHRREIPFFKQFIEYAVSCGFNAVMLELGGAFEYKKHPEINLHWKQYCDTFRGKRGETLKVQNSFPWKKNSIHIENGAGEWLTQEEAFELACFCRENGLEVIPEVPSLSHCDYILNAYPNLAERKEDPFPDTACPGNAQYYEILFDVLSEIIHVFSPARINIGHDEVYSIGLCEKCRAQAPEELYARDILAIYDFLKQHGVTTVLWGDKLLNVKTKTEVPFGGAEIPVWFHGELSETVPPLHTCLSMLPNDIEILHWYWVFGQQTDAALLNHGYSIVYGNYKPPELEDTKRLVQAGAFGICISNWSLMDKKHIQRNGLLVYLAYAQLQLAHLHDTPDEQALLFASADQAYRYWNKEILAQRHFRVTHALETRMDHKEFVDGYYIDESDDYVGQYRVIYADSTVDVFPIYYGYNIGCRHLSLLRSPCAEFEILTRDTQLYEPIGTCNYAGASDDIYYETVFPASNNSAILNVEYIGTKNELSLLSFFGPDGKKYDVRINQ